MAHYKRGKCRHLGPNRTDRTTFYRKRHGLVPIRIPTYSDDFRALRVIGFRYDSISAILSQVRQNYWPNHFHGRGSAPRSHDIMHHNRPRRNAEKRLAAKVLRGSIDAEEALWPLSKRPHVWWD